jgi:O-antigen ligase
MEVELMVINDRKIARAALYLFMFSLNFEVLSVLGDSGNLSMGRISGFIYIGVLVIVKYRFTLHRLANLFYVMMAFIMIVIASSLLHLNYMSIKLFDISLLQNIILCFFLLNHERIDSGVLKKGLYAFVLGTVCLSIFYLLGIGVNVSSGRLKLFGDNQNTIGLRMAISSIYLLYLFFMSERGLSWKNAYMVLPVPLMLSILLASGSRVSFISFALMLPVLLALYLSVNPQKRLVSSLIYFGLAVVILIPFLLSNELMVNRLLAAKGGDLAGRDIIWQSFLPSVFKSPIFGYGFSGYVAESYKIFGNLVSPHNVIIEILLYGGFAALALFALFHVQVLINGIRLYFMRKEYIGLVLLIPYIGGVVSGQTLVTQLMWFILAFNCTSLFLSDTGKKQYKVSTYKSPIN